MDLIYDMIKVMIILIIWTDADLQKIREKNPQLIEKVYKEYKFKIYNFLVIKANGNKHTAEEVLSDTFYSLLKYAHTITNKNKILQWLMQVANRRFFDHLKAKYKEKDIIDCADNETDPFSKEITEILHEKEKALMTHIAINNLKDEYRDVLLLKYLEDKSEKEIAKTMKKTVSSVQSLLFRAREKIKKELKKISKDF